MLQTGRNSQAADRMDIIGSSGEVCLGLRLPQWNVAWNGFYSKAELNTRGLSEGQLHEITHVIFAARNFSAPWYPVCFDWLRRSCGVLHLPAGLVPSLQRFACSSIIRLILSASGFMFCWPDPTLERKQKNPNIWPKRLYFILTWEGRVIEQNHARVQEKNSNWPLGFYTHTHTCRLYTCILC